MKENIHRLGDYGFSGGSDSQESACNTGHARDPGSRSPGGGNDNPTPVLLPGESHGQRSMVGCSPWGREQSDASEQLSMHAQVP